MRAKLGIVLLIACATPAHARTIGEKAVENHIRPVYQRLATATAGLVTAADKFCDGGQKDRAGLSAAFKVAVLAWAGAEHLRFGPIAEQNRYERFAFWPDPKGLGPKQIAAALRDKDASVTTAEGLAQKSVALQGLTAFEILFWGGDAEKPAANAEAPALRCAYAKAIARNLAQISADVRDAWAPADGFTLNGGLRLDIDRTIHRDDRKLRRFGGLRSHHDRLDGRSDTYSLALVLFRMLTGTEAPEPPAEALEPPAEDETPDDVAGTDPVAADEADAEAPAEAVTESQPAEAVAEPQPAAEPQPEPTPDPEPEGPRFGAQFSSPEPTTVTARPRRRATRPALAARTALLRR